MLVSMEPMTMAGRDHCGWPLASRGRGGLWVFFSADQSQAVHRAGKRKPRKNISSKNGAKVTPKANINQAAPGVLIIFSMGALAGPGIRNWSRIARAKHITATPKSGQNQVSASLPRHCNPTKRLSCHTIGKTKRLKPKVTR